MGASMGGSMDWMDRDSIINLLSLQESEDIEELRSRACKVMEKYVGNSVYYRGIIEFSNICSRDCLYCGIRKSSTGVHQRYMLSEEEIADYARWCAQAGYGSIILQSGERRDREFIQFTENVVKRIKKETRSDLLPDGLGITLGIGEQTEDDYQRLYDAGAHRYLLRIETTHEKLFAAIHPEDQKLSERMLALDKLKKIGFQTGTGVMIGLPGQTIEMLADDIRFFKSFDIDMVGMGPYIVHPHAPMAHLGMLEKKPLMQLALKMIAVTRLVLKDVNIAATTALQALYPDGREQGLSFGANVTMPNATPNAVRKYYQLYADKPCINENSNDCRSCLLRRVEATGRSVKFNCWGDAPHALGKTESIV